MKRIISVLLAVAMLCSCLVLLSSCGEDKFIIGYTLFAPMNYSVLIMTIFGTTGGYIIPTSQLHNLSLPNAHFLLVLRIRFH